MTWFLKMNGREVKNPYLKFILIGLILVFAGFVVTLMTGLVSVIMMIIPLILAATVVFVGVLVIPHYVLRMAGRRGFIKTRRTARGKLDMEVSFRDAFDEI